MRIFLPLSVVCALLFVACAAPDTTTPASSTTPANPPPAASISIGVPECDNFLAAYEACFASKAPEASRAAYKAAVEHWRATWKKLAEDPTTKANLPQQCKQTIEQAKLSSIKDFNCTF